MAVKQEAIVTETITARAKASGNVPAPPNGYILYGIDMLGPYWITPGNKVLRLTYNTVGKETATLTGDGTTTEFNINHNLGTENYTPAIREDFGDKNYITGGVAIRAVDADNTKVIFPNAPANGNDHILILNA